MKNVFQEILEWASELSYWEQAAVEKVLNRKELKDADYDELLQYLLEDNNLAEKTSVRKPLLFQQDVYANAINGKPTLLIEVSTLTNVNALVPGQRLTFGPQLTAIFGRNGSGKSGYVRILGCAGFTRGDKEVLPDVTKPLDENAAITAEITLEREREKKTFTYQVGKPCQELSSFYIFDSTSVQVHMKGKNTFSFSPAGLSVLTDLVRVTDEVRARLKVKISDKDQPSDLERYFSGESEIVTLIKALSANTDLDQLATLSKLSTYEERRIHELNVEIGKIGLEKVHEDILKKEEQLHSIQGLFNWLIKAQELLGDDKIAEIEHQVIEFQQLDEKARQLSIENFKHQRFSQTGSDLWQDFMRVAKSLAEAESKTSPYPEVGEPCLLCQQPLSQDARLLILNLWAYLSGEVKSDLERSQAFLLHKQMELGGSSSFNLNEDLGQACDLLIVEDPSLPVLIRSLVERYRTRGLQVESALLQKKPVGKVSRLPSDHSSSIDALIQKMGIEIAELRQEDLVLKRMRLEDERRMLEHRKKLGELLPEIKTYIDGRVWAQEASKVGGSSRHITVKYSQLFNQLVKNRYIEIFKQTLIDLGRPLQVEIATSGSKGESLKQVVIKAHNTAKELADPEKVLSEGEKRAVALADFLTEVALDTSSSGIVLDDPVTSLDLEWRKTIAQLLAKEVAKRQVIVFTHDMPFLYLLLNFVDEFKFDKQVHWIKRGEEDDQPGYVWLNNCPALESDYKKPTLAEKYYIEAKDELQPQKQERILKDGFGALRSTYEALIVFGLLNGVVMRFDERISFGRLEEISWDPGLVKEIVKSCERLSRYIEGHLHSDVMGSVCELTPKLLRDEIDQFIDIRTRLRALKD